MNIASKLDKISDQLEQVICLLSPEFKSVDAEWPTTDQDEFLNIFNQMGDAIRMEMDTANKTQAIMQETETK